MSNDFNINPAEVHQLEMEARRLRAQALSKGLRSLRNWTGKVIHRGSEPASF